MPVSCIRLISHARVHGRPEIRNAIRSPQPSLAHQPVGRQIAMSTLSWGDNARQAEYASPRNTTIPSWPRGMIVPSALTITVYGGAAGSDSATGEIGGNKILVETGDRTFFLDFGTRFGLAGYFFDEFLQP